jgi:CspA family cold shock protein
MNQGTVKFFNSVKGFGFIKNDETEVETFVHVTALKDGLKELSEGQKVTYEVEKDPKNNKDRAINVSLSN